MPKLKTHKGAKRRFHITGSGKFMRRQGEINNYRRRTRRATKRLFGEMLPVHPSARKRLKRLLPYGLP